MASWIDYKDDSITFNNSQFRSTIRFVLEVAHKIANESELHFINKMNKEMVEDYYAGKSIDIETDFPEVEEQKFWAKMFYETAREIFERKIGIHEYFFWQCQRIYQIYGSADLFTKAVRDVEPRWTPNIRDFNEFNEWVNNR